MDAKLCLYLARGAPVQGWLDPYSASFIAALSLAQTRMGVGGGLGEIGVHHGRLFVILKLTAAPKENVFALDVFDSQHLNSDRSGRGSERIFLRNLQRWGVATGVEIIKNSSLNVRPEEITSRVGFCRL